MRNKKYYNAVTVCLLLIVFGVACGDPVTRAGGVVRDETGSPLADVRIVMESSDDGSSFAKETEQVTKPDGSFDFIEITAPAKKVRLVFSKQGFKDVTREVTPSGENKIEVKMEKSTN